MSPRPQFSCLLYTGTTGSGPGELPGSWLGSPGHPRRQQPELGGQGPCRGGSRGRASHAGRVSPGACCSLQCPRGRRPTRTRPAALPCCLCSPPCGPHANPGELPACVSAPSCPGPQAASCPWWVCSREGCVPPCFPASGYRVAESPPGLGGEPHRGIGREGLGRRSRLHGVPPRSSVEA